MCSTLNAKDHLDKVYSMWLSHSEKSNGKDSGKMRKKYIRLVLLEILHLIILVGLILFLIYIL